MSAKTIDRWVSELKHGKFMLSDIQRMGKLRTKEVLRDLALTFTRKILERSLKSQYEIGIAEFSKSEITVGPSAKNGRRPAETFGNCLFLTSEAGKLTGLTLITKLRIRRSPAGKNAFEIFSGYGVSVFHDIDGWMLKIMDQKKVLLSHEGLQKRGWLLSSVKLQRS